MPSGIYNHKETKTPIYTIERNRKISIAQIGKKMSEITKQKMSISGQGKHFYWKDRELSEEHKKKISLAHKGKTLSTAHIKKLSGANCNWWKGGITSINTKVRNSKKYANWRVAVFQRDNYTCKECGSRGVTLNADHIKPFAYYPELRLRIDNGRTLCVPCHKKTDTFAGHVKLKFGRMIIP